jgi:hypothetical protein
MDEALHLYWKYHIFVNVEPFFYLTAQHSIINF